MYCVIALIVLLLFLLFTVVVVLCFSLVVLSFVLRVFFFNCLVLVPEFNPSALA